MCIDNCRCYMQSWSAGSQVNLKTCHTEDNCTGPFSLLGTDNWESNGNSSASDRTTHEGPGAVCTRTCQHLRPWAKGWSQTLDLTQGTLCPARVKKIKTRLHNSSCWLFVTTAPECTCDVPVNIGPMIGEHLAQHVPNSALSLAK